MIRTLAVLMATVLGVLADPYVLPSFPPGDGTCGAEGWGMATSGGRGGQIILVTRTDDTNPGGGGVAGDLRWALTRTYPRTIIIRINGWITLTSGIRLTRANSDFTLVGNKAPGMGAGIRGATIANTSDGNQATNVIIRYMRFRRGYVSVGGYPCLQLGGGSVSTPYGATNWMVANSSFSWASDAILSLNWCSSVTVQDCIVSEAFNSATYGYPGTPEYTAKGVHNYGGIHGHGQASVIRNLYAHLSTRAPFLRGGSWGAADGRNNVNWNCQGAIMTEDTFYDLAHKQNVVANYIKPGPAMLTYWASTAWRSLFVLDQAVGSPNYGSSLTSAEWVYLSDNVIEGYAAATADNRLMDWSGTGTSKTWAVAEATHAFVTAKTAAEAFQYVTNNAGAIRPLRDLTDTRYIKEIHGQAVDADTWYGWPYDEDDYGGWETLSGGSDYTDTDLDGMADNWELEHFVDGAGNPTLARTGRDDYDGDGYTDIEEFLWNTDPATYVDYVVDYYTGDPRDEPPPPPPPPPPAVTGSRSTLGGRVNIQGRVR